MTGSTESTTAKVARHFRFHAPHVASGADLRRRVVRRERPSASRASSGRRPSSSRRRSSSRIWILANVVGLVHFDLYPFILLNLAFSLQAAYAAPLILLAQTRQADRDKAHAEADALHREDLARASIERQELAVQETTSLKALIDQNTELTRVTRELAGRIEELTREIHGHVTGASPS